MRSPFTGVIFTLELTRDVNALLPLLVGALLADFVTVFTMKRSILTEKVARRGVHVSREYGVDVLEQIQVSKVMHREFETVGSDTPIEVVLSKCTIMGGQSVGYPITDVNGRLTGYLSGRDLTKLARRTEGVRMSVGELAPIPKVVAYPDEPVRVAADRMAEADSDSIPVLDSPDERRIVGLVSRDDIFRARVLWFKEESTRERHLSVAAWLSRLSRRGSKQDNEA
jgi:CBS domain-containing protein